MHCVQQILTKMESLYDDDAADALDDGKAKDRLTDLLNDLVKRYAKADTTDLDFVKDADYSRYTQEGAGNAMKVDTLLNVYEALMEFVITHGADIDEEKAGTLKELFQRHKDVKALVKV